MKVIVFTARYAKDNHRRPLDRIQPHAEQVVPEGWEVEWVRFEADRWHEDAARNQGWELRSLPLLDVGSYGDPSRFRLQGRYVKCHPHVLLADDDAWATIWVDSCLEITSPTFVVEAMAACSALVPYATFVHPDRTDLWEEIEAAAPMVKYQGNRHAEMVEAFEQTTNISVDLRAMTVIARWTTWRSRLVDHLVWVETLAWSTPESVALDQLILPFAAEVVGPSVMGDLLPPSRANPAAQGDLWDNAWFIRHPHFEET